MKCDFCKIEGEWKNVIRDANISKRDGSDIMVCNDCLNLYGNQEYKLLAEKMINIKSESE